MPGKQRRRSEPPADGKNLAEELAWLALRLGRLAAGDGGGPGLGAAQWAALRYLARANRFSRTVSALAAFQDTTRGTVSQTIKGLVARGYLRRSPSERDRRSVRFDLTPLGRQLLDQDPFRQLLRAASAMPPAEQSRVLAGLRRLLGGDLGSAAGPRAGRCALCGHLRAGRPDGGAYQCSLLGEPLAPAELAEQCVRFSPRAA